MSGYHVPVLLEPTLEHWITRTDAEAVYVDATLGGGGHSEALLARTAARLIGIDRDTEALREAGNRLARYGERFQTLHANHSDIEDALRSLGVQSVQGILFDLGVSSHQFDTPERGFSVHEDGPLDMRMDTTQALSAETVVNTYTESELARILRAYGEEMFASRIARAIVRARPLTSTFELVEAVKAGIPAAKRRSGIHPARRSFQALRIEVNQELTGLPQAIDGAIRLLAPGGHICIIAFHSLEDRIVKHAFLRGEQPCVCPPKAPQCVCGREPYLRRLTRKPVTATEAEMEENPRARSALLRAAERLDSPWLAQR